MDHFDRVHETLKGLPVAAIAPEVVKSVTQGDVTVVAAPTGSGKSMLVPAMLAKAVDEQVVVLVPRRFLATDAASNVAQMAGTHLGDEVGYAIGAKAGEESKFSNHTKLLFVTYGYAIRSGLINSAKNIVLDEVHEGAEDISLARAILHERKQNDPDLRLLEMSATVDAQRQAGYWKDIATTAIHTVEGQALACEEHRQTPKRDGVTLAQTAIQLVEQGRNGVAIFCSGIRDVESTVKELETLARTSAVPNIEIAQIYGGSPADERANARAAPRHGGKKIIVGTNVIESGVNLRWLDAGISDGFGKIPYDRHDTGAAALVQENLPQWRIVQQRGRINRDPEHTGFDSGIFILHSNTEMASRPQQATPELQRRSLTQIAFRAASLGYHPTQLKFDATIEPARWEQAHEELMRLGLVDEQWALTKEGNYVAKLPLSPETGAMLCEAHRLDVEAARSGDVNLRKRPKMLNEAIIMAAIIENGGLREDHRRGHGFDGTSDVHGGSDVIDALKAYMDIEKGASAKIVADAMNDIEPDAQKPSSSLEKARATLERQCAQHNVNYHAFCDVMAHVAAIRTRQSDKKAIATETDTVQFDTQRYDALKQIILNGYVNRLFQRENAADGMSRYRDLLRDFGNARSDKGTPFSGYGVSSFSILSRAQASSHAPLVVGNLVEVPPRRGGNEPETVLNQLTSIPPEVFIAWAASRQPSLLSEVEQDGQELSARYAGKSSFALPLPKELSAETQQHIATLRENDYGSWAASVEKSSSTRAR